ncbi:NADH-quinone oxidoreductase subunit L [Gemmata obscuriglobus]|uniref:NADH-quinone oxidoreductase subunit L n=1 Tax=Gemmata obscuriglobus TaxID=114 RepID=A0A2Z3H505_9BACT|nr:NADH-quinone oxidoreductase subunit L [Gemmata obscuriglobus]AWM38656.1 NADH-quinone oxidoreductase subunit L [Gemmata obscuriglobus]QEG28382.1 NADH-quinone oxidoreductase subunit L [Gemmata obscuriglobus]VTS06301.1 nadh dehydrogenase subunit l : Proton-translocating NADH-quinone oxidoreductase, chain L OS=Singulisphaera acidiphila (strain ATCC BAA-1392 / DSM 18658 / VKM B-2454 / MOB10) GN=Sinac_1361 PE=4 SV=1: Oxidored_q1_N: Oxidored_q1: Oxidored_q1 [Gemmata obscuriglobus UQM 2246]
MLDWFQVVPGRLYVLATLLPLAAFVLLLVAGAVRALCRPFRDQSGFGGRLYWLYGGDAPLKTGAYLATLLIASSAVLGIVGLVTLLTDSSTGDQRAARWSERADWVRLGPLDSSPPPVWARQHAADPLLPTPKPALALELGYKVDELTAVVFAMVTVIGTLIFVFSLGYMKDELQEGVIVDLHAPLPVGRGSEGTAELSHATDTRDTHSPLPFRDGSPGGGGRPSTRRGRFGRFFLYLSLFSFSMLNLVIADNLFQVFVGWELVGVCSFFLIGFYYERPSASRAANKAFIVNRVGDAGFLIGILIAWTYLGTLNFDEMARRVRSPQHGDRLTHAESPEDANRFVRVDPNSMSNSGRNQQYALPQNRTPGSHLALFPLIEPDPFGSTQPDGNNWTGKLSVPAVATYTTYGVLPYGLFVLMGIGIFLGCAGKSAQVPLQTWLPDAMEGPTPVSALIHAATMVAAGVYLVGRCFPLFAPEVLLTVAYIGAVTLFISATIALVQTDIKRVLAYSTCSQLGFMMLALGLGGWVAGLLHLITHAFFKALLFLCSGSVIHGCHHEQDIRKMGGLKSKMPVTAFTMLVGVLAISGAPLLSGWYSKDMILSTALGYVSLHPAHALLFVLPALTAGLTAYYMFRLWFLTFTGTPRDTHLHDHAHESPRVMTLPLVVLAVFSVGVAWGWPVWSAEASYIGSVLHKAEPAAVRTDFALEKSQEHKLHLYAGAVALATAVFGAFLAYRTFYRSTPAHAALHATGPGWYRFLLGKWYFDEAYDAALVTPTLRLAHTAAMVDKRPPESSPNGFDFYTLDGLLNAIGQAASRLGSLLRGVQTGFVRSYVLALALTAALLLGMLAVLAK